MCRLFGRDRSVITKHIRNIFEEGELDEKSNVHFCTLQIQTNPLSIIISMSSSLFVIVPGRNRVRSSVLGKVND